MQVQYIPSNIKYGLPHIHLLLFLHPNDRLQYCDLLVIDQVISAKFSIEDEDPDGKLFGIVASIIIHGPCGDFNPHAFCMIEINKRMVCSKHFSKAY